MNDKHKQIIIMLEITFKIINSVIITMQLFLPGDKVKAG